MSTDGNLSAVFHGFQQRFKNGSAARALGCDLFCQKKIRVPRQGDVSVNRLRKPEPVIGADTGFFAGFIEIMVCISHFIYVANPRKKHFAHETAFAHRNEIIKCGFNILNFAETYLAESLLRPRKRS